MSDIDKKKIDENERDKVSGGLIFNASNIIGSDYDRPFEVLDDVTGDVVARGRTYDEAVSYAKILGKKIEYTEDWNYLQWLRSRPR